jgi:hypothetical protein
MNSLVAKNLQIPLNADNEKINIKMKSHQQIVIPRYLLENTNKNEKKNK